MSKPIAIKCMGVSSLGLALLLLAETAGAAVMVANGSFETTSGPTGVGGILLASGWTAENLATVGGIQNATWVAGQEGVTAAQVTGTRWGRLVGDVGLDGGLNQAIGSLANGESVTIVGDYFTGGNAGPVIAYSPRIELYDGDPLGSGSLLTSATLSGGALNGATNNSSTFSLSFTAAGGNGANLFLRLRTNSTAPADNGGATVVTRGGIDNIRVIPEPASLALAGVALLGILGLGRRTRHASIGLHRLTRVMRMRRPQSLDGIWG